jgi:hypothetical protein
MSYNISVGNQYKASNGTIYTVSKIDATGFVCTRVDKNGKKLSKKSLSSTDIQKLTIYKG